MSGIKTYYRVLYSFKDDEQPAALSVESDEIVYCDEDQKENEGWLEVTKYNDVTQKGCVPFDYILETNFSQVVKSKNYVSNLASAASVHDSVLSAGSGNRSEIPVGCEAGTFKDKLETKSLPSIPRSPSVAGRTTTLAKSVYSDFKVLGNPNEYDAQTDMKRFRTRNFLKFLQAKCIN